MCKRIKNSKNSKDRLSNDKTQKTSIYNTNNPLNIKINFKYFCFKSIKIKEFTNLYKNYEDFLSLHNRFFQEFLPRVTGSTFIELETQNKNHCHYIDLIKHRTQLNIIYKVLNEYLKFYPEYTDTYLKYISSKEDIFYQLSLPRGFRAIGVRTGDNFNLLFMDWFHLIYLDSRYDTEAIHCNRYSKWDRYSTHITVINLEHAVLTIPECENCPNLEKAINNLNQD